MGPVKSIVENTLVTLGKSKARGMGIPESDIQAVCRKLEARDEQTKAGLERLMADADWVDANISQRGKDIAYRETGKRIGRPTLPKSHAIKKKPRPVIEDKKANKSKKE